LSIEHYTPSVGFLAHTRRLKFIRNISRDAKGKHSPISIAMYMLKEAGQLQYAHWNTALEGWAMWLLTKFGEPEPWTPTHDD
jgi:predicted component of type VI protein secretion system